MQVIEVIIPYTRSNIFPIYPIGDIHLGTVHCREDLIKAKVREVAANPLARWVGMGDYSECITPHDKRWDIQVISKWVHEDNIAHDLERMVCKLFAPIKSQCLGLILGNHENTIRLRNNDNIQQNICDELGLLNLGHSAFVRFVFRRSQRKGGMGEGRNILGVFTHGAGGAITRGAKINRLERFMDHFNARIYAHGHVHDIIIDTKPYLDLNGANKIIGRQKVGAMTGSFFTSYSQDLPPSYAETKNYPPSVLGCPTFFINPDKDEVRVEM